MLTFISDSWADRFRSGLRRTRFVARLNLIWCAVVLVTLVVFTACSPGQNFRSKNHLSGWPQGSQYTTGDNPYKNKGLKSGRDYYQEGVASWYGRAFHGRKTANGERFDMHQMTAAHRTLPFGSWALVKNIATGQEVVVRINDRGPFHNKRLIDLSQAAAGKIGLNGLSQVSVKSLTEAEARKFM